MIQPLRREVGIFGATMMGLGSIVGTGVFVSIGVAAGIAGPSVIPAIAVGALVATCNGLSSAQLAASHPVSGGTYEYGYRYLTPGLGFAAGWMFLCAKSASAATASLGFAGYLFSALGSNGAAWHVPVALVAVTILTLLVCTGIRRSSTANVAIVSVTLFTLVFFAGAGFPTAVASGSTHLRPFFSPDSSERQPIAAFLEACTLMFVAYTGYGRIATLGEEVRDPSRNIPRAIILTLLVSMLLYVAVGTVAIAAVGAQSFGMAGTAQAAPLGVVARQFPVPGAALVIAVGAVTAMLGVLLNLILGLSRVLLAMGRRLDMPSAFAKLDRSGRTPTAAVVLVGAVIAALVLIGNVKTTWSFSAFTVLIYYALTNLAALRLPASQRRYPRFVAIFGLAACLFLAFWVEPTIWLVGLGLLAVGILWHLAARRLAGSKRSACDDTTER